MMRTSNTLVLRLTHPRLSIGPRRGSPLLKTYQITFTASWICRELVAVWLICPAPLMPVSEPVEVTPNTLFATGGRKFG
jgi:hypothetical protein